MRQFHCVTILLAVFAILIFVAFAIREKLIKGFFFFAEGLFEAVQQRSLLQWQEVYSVNLYLHSFPHNIGLQSADCRLAYKTSMQSGMPALLVRPQPKLTTLHSSMDKPYLENVKEEI